MQMLVLVLVLVLMLPLTLPPLLMVGGELLHGGKPRVDGASDQDHQHIQLRSGAGQAEDSDAGATAPAGCLNDDQKGTSVESGEK